MSDAINLQEAILKEVRRDKVPVTLFLMNGFQLRGVITGYDSFVVVLVSDGKQQMIYKHAIDREAARQGIVQDILLEVNIGEEASKSGFAAEDILPLMEKIGEFSNICIKGLMAIPPISHISGENQKFFQKMFHLSVDIRQKKYDNVKVDCLSMGMSGDFADAIASGSTMVRVGTAIFGARDYARDSSK